MENNEQKAPFSPILIMEFIRQTTIARCLTNENPNLETKFRLGKTYYDQIMSFPLQAQLIRLTLAYVSQYGNTIHDTTPLPFHLRYFHLLFSL